MRGRVHGIVLLLFALCPLVGAEETISPWPTYGGNSGHSFHVPYQGPRDFNTKWVVPRTVTAEPVVGLDNTIYIGEDTRVVALNSVDGTERWTYQAGGVPVTALSVGTDGVLFVTAGSRLIALGPDGGEQWIVPFPDSLVFPPMVDENQIVVVTTTRAEIWRDHLYGVSYDGSVRWQFDLDGHVFWMPSPYAQGLTIALVLHVRDTGEEWHGSPLRELVPALLILNYSGQIVSDQRVRDPETHSYTVPRHGWGTLLDGKELWLVPKIPGTGTFVQRVYDEQERVDKTRNMIDRIDLSSLEDPNEDNGSFEIKQMPIEPVCYRPINILGVALSGLGGLYFSIYEYDDFMNYSYYGLTALDAYGVTRWSYEGDLTHLISDAEGWVYGISNDDLLVFDAEGSLRCSRKIPTPAGCILGGDGVMVLWTDDGKLYALGNPGAPETPEDVTAVPLFDNAIQLRWRRGSGDISGIVVERKRADANTFSEIISIAAEESAFVDEGLEPFTPYTYKIRAFHQEQFSDYSVPVSVQTVALGDTPWPMRGYDPSLSGKTPLLGPECPAAKWKYRLTARGAPAQSIKAVLLGEGEAIYMVASGNQFTDDSALYVLSPEGEILSHHRVAKGMYVLSNVHSFFVGEDGWIYLSAGYRYDEWYTGQTHWRTETHRINPHSGEMEAFAYPLPEEHPEHLPGRVEDGAGKIYRVEGSELVVSDPDRGETWRLDVGEELVHPLVLGENRTLYLASRRELFDSITYGYTLWAIGEQVVPDAYALHQNAPNPFNGRTTIRFDLQAESHVELCIFNIAGQKIATLSDHVKRAGHYALTWDGRSAQERAVASGVYLYRMVAGNHQEVKRMVVLR